MLRGFCAYSIYCSSRYLGFQPTKGNTRDASGVLNVCGGRGRLEQVGGEVRAWDGSAFSVFRQSLPNVSIKDFWVFKGRY